MRVCMPAVYFAASMTALAAINSVSVPGTTSTQAILQYSAPDTNACTVEVSESSNFVPLVHDVDPALFAGSNLDSRSESTSDGTERVFVIGKRRAERGVDGRWYSRALQAYTRHYYRITCGSDQITGDFSTTNIPLGNTYNDALPADPNAGKTGYFVNAGEYAWPEFLNWDKTTGRSETVIDPHTGMLLKRMTMPGDQPTGNRPAGDHLFGVATSSTSTWSNPGNALIDDNSSTVFSGTGRDWLTLRDPSLSYNDYYLESLVFSVKGWCTGPCAGDDAKIQACLTVNGVSCWPDQNNTLDITLGTTANTSTLASAGSASPIMGAWTPSGLLPLNAADTRQRSGNVNVDAAGNVTLASGDFFYPNWTAGSKITIAGTECSISSVAHPKSLKIDPSSCASLTLPQSNAGYSAGNFGVMIRKKTSSTDTISIQYAKYSMTESLSPGWTSSGSPKLCSDTLTQNPVTGGMGYHCAMPANQLYWINPSTGESNYLGLFFFPGKGGTDGWSAGPCINSSATFIGKGPLDPEQFYCATGDNAGKEVILACAMTSNNQPNNLGISCTNLTKSSAGLDLLALVQQFTAGYTPSYDPVNFNGCAITGLQNNRLIMGCYRGYQDTLGWVVVFDPAKVDTAAGCVGGGNPGCVIAAQPSWMVAPARWCTIHTLFMSGNSNTAWVIAKWLGGWEGMPGGGRHISTVVSGTMTSTPTITAGTSGCPPDSKGCDMVTVDGEPCNPNPAGSVGGHPAEGGNCPKNPAWEYLQDAQPGDILVSTSPQDEYMKLIAKNGNNWLIQRGFGYTTPSNITVPVVLAPLCSGRNFDNGQWGGGWTWDFDTDPHGLNADGHAVRIPPAYAHPLPRPNLVVGTVGAYDPGYGYGITDGPGYGMPTKWEQMGPAFASVYGVTVFNESSQDHPSHPQETAPASEQRWFLDARPLHGPGAGLATKVSGQLYKFSSTTTDGDNLTRLGGQEALPGPVARKRQPTLALCGAQPLIDISSATQGNTIADDSTSAYQYCVARKSGECRSGSAAGDAYVNCPFVTPRPDNSYGCDFTRLEANLANDMCIYNTGAYLNAVAQIGFEHSDPWGELGRSLTKGLVRYRLVDINENVHSLPDGSWLLIESNAMNGSAFVVLGAKVPPFPEVDSVNRQTFIPLVLNLTPPQGASIDNAIVEFGYAENGAVDQFYCTSRRENCIANSATVVEANPFHFPSEGTDGTSATVAGVPCSTSCSVTIPGLPQRVVYYHVVYRNSSNQVVTRTPLQMTVTP